ncbi:response regulator [Chromatiaceae bacterium AAb-1]|nr:response regulator [Chromatiaceae bacterium AAb-1]
MTNKVLIVDDSRVSRIFIRNFIRQLQPQWQIFEADGGKAAIALAAEHRFYAVSLDYNMPEMNGFEVADRLKAIDPHCFIGLLTANVQRSTQEQAQAAGLYFYKKPINLEMMQQMMMDVEAYYAAV